jgi:hypothetical protein
MKTFANAMEDLLFERTIHNIGYGRPGDTRTKLVLATNDEETSDEEAPF